MRTTGRQPRRSACVMVADSVPLLVSLTNYAETLVRPFEDEAALRAALAAIEALGIQLVAPTAAIARDAARLRGLNISLADGFAIATARASGASVASFDRRVRRALATARIELAPAVR
jgi:hypothetical protein